MTDPRPIVYTAVDQSGHLSSHSPDQHDSLPPPGTRRKQTRYPWHKELQNMIILASAKMNPVACDWHTSRRAMMRTRCAIDG
jgi:hypothetical protein